MDSSQVFLAKSILQALIHDIDLGNTFHGQKAFTRFVWKILPAGLPNSAVRLLSVSSCRGRFSGVTKKPRDLVR